MDCLEDDQTNHDATKQSGCHGPARRAPPLFWFDIRRNMPHTDSLTFDVMSPPATHYKNVKPAAFVPRHCLLNLRSAVRSLVSGLQVTSPCWTAAGFRACPRGAR